MPYFSVIVTTYNRAGVLGRTLHAVLAQTFQDFELIVVDDCSTDDTIEVLAGFGDRLRFFSTRQNSGDPARPRNTGMQHATGEWICFCDSDDAFEPDHLERLYSHIKANKIDDAIITTNAWIMIDGKKTGSTYFKRRDGVMDLSLVADWKRNMSILSSLCIRHKSIVPFREQNSFRGVEDYLFLLDNMLNGKKHIYFCSPGVSYNDNSDDSHRSVHYYNAHRLYKYKMLLWKQYKLGRTAHGAYLLGVVWCDYIKYLVKKISGKIE
jgi:glycosyltransferase involved in cell wall biosynthesis